MLQRHGCCKASELLPLTTIPPTFPARSSLSSGDTSRPTAATAAARRDGAGGVGSSARGLGARGGGRRAVRSPDCGSDRTACQCAAHAFFMRTCRWALRTAPEQRGAGRAALMGAANRAKVGGGGVLLVFPLRTRSFLCALAPCRHGQLILCGNARRSVASCIFVLQPSLVRMRGCAAGSQLCSPGQKKKRKKQKRRKKKKRQLLPQRS